MGALGVRFTSRRDDAVMMDGPWPAGGRLLPGEEPATDRFSSEPERPAQAGRVEGRGGPEAVASGPALVVALGDTSPSAR